MNLTRTDLPGWSLLLRRFAGLSSWAYQLTLALLAFTLSSSRVHAAIQFDAFLGFDGIIPEACWFPLVFEIKNDGPAFTGTIEVSSGNINRASRREVLVELPTGTLKRIVVPVFASGRGFASWDARLLDERGKLRAEQPRLQPRKQIGSDVPLLGAIPRGASGAPQIRPVLPQQADLQPATARILPGLLPDNPLVLERLSAFYLNSEIASELGVPQVEALLAWIQAGGNLIVAIEQPSDLNAAPWLKSILPCEPTDLQQITNHTAFHQWITASGWPAGRTALRTAGQQPSQSRTTEVSNPFGYLSLDAAFEGAPIQVVHSRIKPGASIEIAGDLPFVVSLPFGRGRVTALLFSPEREPFRSWKHQPIFWARIVQVPASLYSSSDYNYVGGWSSDGVFGAMLDSRQVHKLPIGWLLALLLVYLLVIGPLDHYWLKRIGRPMLTWITFPAYVVLFSVVIYFIGYKLRAGDSEWNELHVTDVFPKNQTAALRGRTYASVYSPSNERYQLESQQQTATLRGEFTGMWSGSQAADETRVMIQGNKFKAEVFVPVWTSRILVSDWWDTVATPMSVSVVAQGAELKATIQNRTASPFSKSLLAYKDRIFPLGEVSANGSASFTVRLDQGQPLRDFVWPQSSHFQTAIQSRQYAFGSARTGWIDDRWGASAALTFLSHGNQSQPHQNSFILPPGLELSSVLDNGNAVILAWADNYSPTKPMRNFASRRVQQFTLWRISTPIN